MCLCVIFIRVPNFQKRNRPHICFIKQHTQNLKYRFETRVLSQWYIEMYTSRLFFFNILYVSRKKIELHDGKLVAWKVNSFHRRIKLIYFTVYNVTLAQAIWRQQFTDGYYMCLGHMCITNLGYSSAVDVRKMCLIFFVWSYIYRLSISFNTLYYYVT